MKIQKETKVTIMNMITVSESRLTPIVSGTLPKVAHR